MDYRKSAIDVLAKYGKIVDRPAPVAPPSRRQRNEPTPERLQHGEFDTTDTMVAGVKVWQQRDPLKLDQYHGQRRITGIQHEAGLRYRELAVDAGKAERGARWYNGFGGQSEMSDEKAKVDRAFRDAGRAVGSYIMAVDALCVYDWHAPIDEVRVGLDRLAVHFGYARRCA